MRALLEGTGGRRFFICLGAGMATTLLQWLGCLDKEGHTYGTVICWVITVYVGGNTYQKVKAPAPVDPATPQGQ